jgi:phosphate transport system protein
MGDLSINISERASYLSTHETLEVSLDFPRMIEGVRKMVKGSLDALVNQDTRLARGVLVMDDDIDSINRDMYTTLQEVMRQDSGTIERAVHLLSASRHLERIADLATNIAEDVVFMVEGELIRHHFEDYAGGNSKNLLTEPK